MVSKPLSRRRQRFFHCFPMVRIKSASELSQVVLISPVAEDSSDHVIDPVMYSPSYPSPIHRQGNPER